MHKISTFLLLPNAGCNNLKEENRTFQKTKINIRNCIGNAKSRADRTRKTEKLENARTSSENENMLTVRFRFVFIINFCSADHSISLRDHIQETFETEVVLGLTRIWRRM